MHRKLTYSNVTATVAMFLALSGGAYAAVDLVGRNDIKSRHVAPDALTGDDIDENSLYRVFRGRGEVRAQEVNFGVAGDDVDRKRVLAIEGKHGPLIELFLNCRSDGSYQPELVAPGFYSWMDDGGSDPIVAELDYEPGAGQAGDERSAGESERIVWQVHRSELIATITTSWTSEDLGLGGLPGVPPDTPTARCSGLVTAVVSKIDRFGGSYVPSFED